MEYYIGYLISGIVIIIAIFISLFAQTKVNGAFNKYKDVPSSLGMTGAELAEKMARENNLDIVVRMCSGHLTDHYNPKDKSLNISEANYHGTSVSAHAIVAHEFGHAMQDAKNYAPLKIRQFVIKTSNFVSKLLMPLLILGILLQIFLFSSIAGSLVIYISVALYGVSVIASLVTLPVEYNASSRAKKILIGMGSVSEDEVKGTDDVLNAAALTYVASLLLSLAYFLRFLFLLLAIRDR